MPGPAPPPTLPALASFGAALKYLRRRARLSQRDLSIAVGYSESQISRFESHHRPPDLPTLQARFVPALHLEKEPEVVAKLLALAAAARREAVPDWVTSALARPQSIIAKPADTHHRPASRPTHNLPSPLTSFVGRDKERLELQQLLEGEGSAAARLVTLTGTGGTGKTRLALQVATDVLGQFSSGTWFVELCSISNPTHVSQSVATVLGLRELPGYPLSQTIADHVRSGLALLILDNCEHLIDECAGLAEALLRACPNLRILATSREALGLLGETTFLVQPLALPSAAETPGVEAASGAEALQLFVDRARAVRPGFQLTQANVATVAEICRRLDGVPLAIELAAARMRALSEDQIAERLEDRFQLLAGGNRTALPRHQTLLALVDWGHELLPEPERIMLRRLSVFQAGWTVEAAEAVCAGGDLASKHVLGLMMRLVDKSLVAVEEHVPTMRYRLLDTVRQYAWNKAQESGESQALHARFYAYYLRQAEEATSKLKSAEQIVWLPRLEAEHDNFQAALDWALISAPNAPDASLRLAAALAWFWYLRGSWSLARDRLEEVLAAAGQHGPATPFLRARVLNALAFQAECQSDEARALAAARESESLCRAAGDAENLAYSLANQGEVLFWQGEPISAVSPLDESIRLFRSLDPPETWGLALGLKHLAEGVFFQDDLVRADALFEESIRLFRQLGDRWGLANALEGQAAIAVRLGNKRRAITLIKEGLALQQELNYPFGWVHVVNRLGHAINEARAAADFERVKALLAESLDLARAVGHLWGMSESLRKLAELALVQGHPERAAQLMGASEALREADPVMLPPYPVRAYEDSVAALRSVLGSEALTTAWTQGQTLSPDQAMALALETTVW
jgi:non-specific serine/threonine protein kinase